LDYLVGCVLPEAKLGWVNTGLVEEGLALAVSITQFFAVDGVSTLTTSNSIVYFAP
jgi:hypothetical protein